MYQNRTEQSREEKRRDKRHVEAVLTDISGLLITTGGERARVRKEAVAHIGKNAVERSGRIDLTDEELRVDGARRIKGRSRLGEGEHLGARWDFGWRGVDLKIKLVRIHRFLCMDRTQTR